MTIPLDFMQNVVEIFLLIFVRVSGMFVVAPIFSRKNFPSSAKVGLAFMITMVMVNVVPVPNLDKYTTLLSYFILIAKELIVGIFIGFIAYVVLSAIYLGGQLIDMRMGFGMVNVIDPLSNTQIPITANFYFILSMLVFLMINGHHMLIYTLMDSYEYIPIGNFYIDEQSYNEMVKLFTNIFMLGFKIAAPITAAIMLTDVALGVVAKAVPQINVFVIGFPIKIFLGFIIILVTLGAFFSIINVLMEGMHDEMYKFMRFIGS